MKKLFVTILLIALGTAYVMADCSSDGCPGSGKICCKENFSYLWGAVSWTETYYSNQSEPTDGEDRGGPVEEQPDEKIAA